MRQELTYNLCLSYWDKLSGNELLLGYFLLSLKWCSKSLTLISETDQFSTDISGSTHLTIDFWGDLLWCGFLSTCDLIKQRKRATGSLGRSQPEWEVGARAGGGESACGWSSSPLGEWQDFSSWISGGIYLLLYIYEFVFRLHSLINC